MMTNMFSVNKAGRSKLRKLPLLARFGFTVELGGWQLTYKHVPLLESVLNFRERGFKNFSALRREELDEVRFPAHTRPLATVSDLHAKAAKRPSVKASRKASKAGKTKAAAPVKTTEAEPIKATPV